MTLTKTIIENWNLPPQQLAARIETRHPGASLDEIATALDEIADQWVTETMVEVASRRHRSTGKASAGKASA